MVVRFVCVIRVPVCARVSCVSRVSRLPPVSFYRYFTLLLYNGSASALVSATAPPLYLRAPKGVKAARNTRGRANRRGPRAACVNQKWFHYSTA